ncbi:unnamed protein product, partial [Urochloa humidicola]
LPATPSSPRPLPPILRSLPSLRSADSELGEFGQRAARRCRPLPPPPLRRIQRGLLLRSPVRACSAFASRRACVRAGFRCVVVWEILGRFAFGCCSCWLGTNRRWVALCVGLPSGWWSWWVRVHFRVGDPDRSGEMEGAIVRRVIPSDNSCLFNAVGYVMEHNRNKASELRQVIAATVASDPVKFNEVFLGKPNEAYCAWILDPEKWGGAIELSILSEYYGREIAAYDIQTTRCDLYGQEKNYSERVMLIYDGLHYDALAMSPAEGAPEEFDQTIFPVNHNRSIGPAEGLALNLVKEAQRKRSYTDTANFTLRCGVCQIGVIGQKEAVEHAQATGHINFQEYK